MLAPNGKIYFVPVNADSTGVRDPSTDFFTTIRIHGPIQVQGWRVGAQRYVNRLGYKQTKLFDSTRTQNLFWTNLTAQEVEFLIDNGSQTDEEESDTVEG